MIKTICDHCKKEISNPLDRVDIEISIPPFSKQKPLITEKVNLHSACFCELYKKVTSGSGTVGLPVVKGRD